MNVRKSSRAIILNKDYEIFLFQYHFDYFVDENIVWITPGGGLEDGETFEMALRRELYEELGIHIDQNYSQIYYRNPIYSLKNGEKVQCEEKFFLIYLDRDEFTCNNWTRSEQQRMKRGRWWSIDLIMHTNDEFFTSDIIHILKNLKFDKIPQEPIEIA